MKLKFIVLTLFAALVMPFAAFSADIQKTPVLTEAVIKGNVLEISGEISGGLKGVDMGLVVYDNEGNIVHIDQAKTQSLPGTKQAVTFSFTKTNMRQAGGGYKAVVSAKGYAKTEKTIDYIDVVEFYVSPEGSANADGSFANPFGTLEDARNAVRAYKEVSGGLLRADVIVYLRGGEYVRTSAFTLSAEDSGNNGHTVTYREYPGESVKIIAAGTVLTEWTEDNGVWKAQGGAKNVFSINDADGKIGSIAREPNSGYAYSALAGSTADYYTFKEKKATDIKDFEAQVGAVDFNQELYVAMWPSMTGYDYWSDEVTFFKVTSVTNGVASFQTYSDVGGLIAADSKYYLMGAKEFLDAEGEFHYSTTAGETSFIPPAGYTMTKDTVLYTAGNFSPISIAGSESAPVCFVNISGMEIAGANRLYPGVKIENASDISVSRMNIHDTNDNGIYASGIINRIEISDNRISNVGACGIALISKYTEKSAPDKKGSYSKDNKVCNNHVSNVGNLRASSSAIRIFNCEDTLVSNNLVHGSARFGIEFNSNVHLNDVIGATIEGTLVTENNAHEFVPTRGNIIEYNDVYDCMKDSEDGGLIYMVAHDNIIRYNHLHDSTAAMKDGLIGLYLDDGDVHADGSSHNEVYGNRVYNLDTVGGSGVSVTGYNIRGINNTLTNNIAANLTTNGGWAYRFDNPGNVFSGNIAYNAGNGVVYVSNISTTLSECNNNIYYNEGGTESSLRFYYMRSGSTSYNDYSTYTLSQWKAKGYDANSKFANPGFMDADNADFRMSETSGFYDIYSQNIGLTTDYPYSEDADWSKLFVSVNDEEANPAVVTTGDDKTIKFTVFARNEKGYGTDNVRASFVSHNDDIVTVSQDGTLNITGRGKARVTVSAGGISTDIYVNVSGAGIWFEDTNGNYLSSFDVNTKDFIAMADSAELDINGASLIVGIYEGDKLIKTFESSTPVGNVFSVPFSSDNLGTFSKIKAFLWKKDILYPILRSKTITKE